MTTLTVGSSLTVALLVPDQAEKIYAIVGATAVCVVCYVIPVKIQLELHSRRRKRLQRQVRTMQAVHTIDLSRGICVCWRSVCIASMGYRGCVPQHSGGGASSAGAQLGSAWRSLARMPCAYSHCWPRLEHTRAREQLTMSVTAQMQGCKLATSEHTKSPCLLHGPADPLSWSLTTLCLLPCHASQPTPTGVVSSRQPSTAISSPDSTRHGAFRRWCCSCSGRWLTAVAVSTHINWQLGSRLLGSPQQCSLGAPA